MKHYLDKILEISKTYLLEQFSKKRYDEFLKSISDIYSLKEPKK